MAPPSNAVLDAVVAECEKASAPAALGEAGQLLKDVRVLSLATLLSIVLLVNSCLAAPATAGSSAVHTVCKLLSGVLEAEFGKINNLQAALDLAAACVRFRRPGLLRAAFDACLRCAQSGASLQQVQAIWGLLRDFDFLPDLQQVKGLVGISITPSIAAEWTGEKLLGCFQVLDSIYNKRPAEGCWCRVFLPVSSALAIQPLVQLFVSLLRSNKASQAHAITLVSLCGYLRVIPVGLLQYLNLRGRFTFELVSWQQLRLLLVACGNLGLGMHSDHDPRGMQQPLAFIEGLFKRGIQLLGQSLPSMPEHSRSICRAIAYINHNHPSAMTLLYKLALHGGVIPHDCVPCHKSLHDELWQARAWLIARRLGRLPWGVAESLLDWARTKANSACRPSCHQRQMREALCRLHCKDSRINWVSHCEELLRGVDFSADVLVLLRNGLQLVFEYEGDGHLVGPYGSASGATLWRNLVLRGAGYNVISVTEAEWAAAGTAAAQEELLLGKMRAFL